MIRELIEFDVGPGTFIDQQQEIAQNISSRLKLIKTENYRNLNDGVDWPRLLGKPVNLVLVESELKRVVYRSDEVLQITGFNIQQVDRSLQVTITVATQYGSVTVQEIFNGTSNA